MNTPAHVVVNLLILGRKENSKSLSAIAAGAVLPDLPIFVFYFVEKLLRQRPESVIWGYTYFHDGWQNFIDAFNSLPILTLGWVVSWLAKVRTGTMVMTSMILHIAEDLPLHHDDAHRHFFPLSDWRFHSPVSYWDPHYHGDIVSWLEIVLVLIGSAILFRRYRQWTGRGLVGLAGISYIVYFVYAWIAWI